MGNGSSYLERCDYGVQLSDFNDRLRDNNGIDYHDFALKNALRCVHVHSICDGEVLHPKIGLKTDYQMTNFFEDIQSNTQKTEERTLTTGNLLVYHFTYHVIRPKIVSSPFLLGFIGQCSEFSLAKYLGSQPHSLDYQNHQKVWFFPKKVSLS